MVETVFHTLSARFGLTFPRARTYWGLLTRLGAKVAAFNLAVYVNHLFNRPMFGLRSSTRLENVHHTSKAGGFLGFVP